MSSQRRTGTTPLDGLRSHFDDSEATCPECGYEDDDGGWKAVTTGDRVLYRHVCPSCGAISKRTLRLK